MASLRSSADCMQTSRMPQRAPCAVLAAFAGCFERSGAAAAAVHGSAGGAIPPPLPRGTHQVAVRRFASREWIITGGKLSSGRASGSFGFGGAISAAGGASRVGEVLFRVVFYPILMGGAALAALDARRPPR